MRMTHHRLRAVVGAVLAVAVGLGLALGSAAAASPPVRADDHFDDKIAEANREKAQREKEIDQIENDLKHTDAEIVEANSKLLRLEGELPGLRVELEQAQDRLDEALLQQEIVADKLAAAEAQDRAITEQIDEDQARVEELRRTVAALARDSYKGSGSQASLSVVFGSTTSREFVDQYTFQHAASRAQAQALSELEQFASVNRNRGARQESVREYIEELKVIADELVVEADLAREEAEEKKEQVEDALEEVRVLQAELKEKKAAAEAKQRELEKEQDKIEDQLLDLIRKKIESEGPQNPTPIGSGYLAYPTANPYITSSYGNRYHPIFGRWILHAGTDFRAYCGTRIYAAADGRVEWARWQGGFGRHVMLDHGFVNGNALNTSYAHLSSFAVSSGQYVTRGTVIGYSGSTGNSTACHLHFETYVGGSTVNPMSLLD